MTTMIDKYTADGCSTDDRHKVCRTRGGESCAFDGAMIVLQPIADTAHIVHGPIACCGNSWEGRGSLSRQGDLDRRGFTTDMREIDIVYGSGDKLLQAIRETCEAVRPKAIFVHATCVSGLIGEDIDAVCRTANIELGLPVISVNAPGFVGPKNLGNRIAGEVLLEQVIGRAEPPVRTHYDINLIGEYNIAGDLWLVEPLLARAGIRVLSRITGNATFEEIAWAHRAKLNVVVCGRALINVARGMEERFGVPFIEASFFGRTETAAALRRIAEHLDDAGASGFDLADAVERTIRSEERRLDESLRPYGHLRGKKAVLYTGGVKSWSFISALRDLGIGIVAAGTKKSTVEDEEKMKMILGPDAPLVEDVTPKNLLRLLKDRGADMLIAGGRNQYLAVKEGYPFVDVNQERHTAYAGYEGLVNLAGQISGSMKFYENSAQCSVRSAEEEKRTGKAKASGLPFRSHRSAVVIDPLKHSPAMGAAIALQGIDRALPIIHGSQGCGFLGKVLLTKHFREPIALATTRLFVENVVMGGEETVRSTAAGFLEKNAPALIGILTSGLSEVKGDDVRAAADTLRASIIEQGGATEIIAVPTPDYDGGLETGYARAVEAVIKGMARAAGTRDPGQVNILAGSHLTPADFNELREIAAAFGIRPVILPDLSALDGSRQGMSPLAANGTAVDDIRLIGASAVTLVVGKSLEPAARLLKDVAGVPYRLFEGMSGLAATDRFLRALSEISGTPIPERLVRQRAALVDGMRDAHPVYGEKSFSIALEPDHAAQMAQWLSEMGGVVRQAVIPQLGEAADLIKAESVEVGDLSCLRGSPDLIVASSHASGAAKRLNAPLYEAGFPVFKMLGYPHRTMIGYRGGLSLVNDIGTRLMHVP